MSTNIDRDQRNADWIKTLSWEYPTDMEQFLMFIGGPEQLEHFLTLPVAEQMPLMLRVELGLAHNPKGLKFDPDQLRDRVGRWVEGGGAGAGSGTALLERDDSMAHVHFTIGTLDADEQKTVHETLDRLGEKYPAVASMITAVQARPLKHVWGRMSDQGEMQLTNLGRKHEDMHDPDLVGTVTHEFGHAIFRNMAGITEPNVPPEGRPPTFNRQLDAGVPVSVIRESIRQYNEVLAEYNAVVQEQQDRVDAFVVDMHRKIGNELGNDADRIEEQLITEFGGGPGYVATRGGESISYSDYLEANPEEVLAQAFSHYENGKHGVIADVVGHVVEEHYA